MGIKANNSRDTLGSVQFFGLTALNNIVTSATLASSNRVGASRNIFASDAGINAKSSIPAGSRHPVAFLMPQKGGGLASHNNTRINISQTGNAVLGLPGSGTSTITFTSTATGGLVVSGSGSATVTFSATGSILSIASGSGTANITFSPTGLIGALAGISGQANITCTPSALISAIGYLSGLSTNETEFSANALAQAVWDAAASDFNLPGTMGELQNNAGAAGNPWSSLLASNNTAGTFGEFVQSLLEAADFTTAINAVPTANENADALLDRVNGVEAGITLKEASRIMLSALAGKISGAGTNTITIRDVNDSKNRVVATVDGDGNRTAVTLDDS